MSAHAAEPVRHRFASFAPVKRAPGAGGEPLLAPAAHVALGDVPEALVAPVAPTAGTLFGPRGVCLHPDGSLWVADTGHHRLLGWRSLPATDRAPASVLFGQPSFDREGRNAKGAMGPATLNVPAGLCAFGAGLVLADSWNHRVLIWRRPPAADNQPPDIVLGQADLGGGDINRGAALPGADTLYWPSGVADLGGALAVADAGNRRVLVWHDPTRDGQPADLVLGQRSFESRDENGGVPVSARGMRWPHAIAWWQGHLAVADAGNNRVMLWRGLPSQDGAPCDAALGQVDLGACDHNQGAYYPTASALNMPYGLAVAGDRLIVADTANSRLLGFRDPATGVPADVLAGQPDFASKGDNGWGPTTRASLCWPYGIAVQGGLAAVADSGNNRVLLWRLS